MKSRRNRRVKNQEEFKEAICENHFLSPSIRLDAHEGMSKEHQKHEEKKDGERERPFSSLQESLMTQICYLNITSSKHL